jgi:hypothetical protein
MWLQAVDEELVAWEAATVTVCVHETCMTEGLTVLQEGVSRD